MMPDMNFQGKRCLVFVADDMGKSVSVNRAIAEAHDKGLLDCSKYYGRGRGF